MVVENSSCVVGKSGSEVRGGTHCSDKGRREASSVYRALLGASLLVCCMYVMTNLDLCFGNIKGQVTENDFAACVCAATGNDEGLVSVGSCNDGSALGCTTNGTSLCTGSVTATSPCARTSTPLGVAGDNLFESYGMEEKRGRDAMDIRRNSEFQLDWFTKERCGRWMCLDFIAMRVCRRRSCDDRARCDRARLRAACEVALLCPICVRLVWRYSRLSMFMMVHRGNIVRIVIGR